MIQVERKIVRHTSIASTPVVVKRQTTTGVSARRQTYPAIFRGSYVNALSFGRDFTDGIEHQLAPIPLQPFSSLGNSAKWTCGSISKPMFFSLHRVGDDC